ncbi:MAG: metallophosphoesterase [Chloroflexi bacterium]|nr:metallophosphoesterase [Chloroflexota bacterium]
MRYVVFSDIHGNFQALQAILEQPEVQEANAFWCLGDVVGYGPDPNACVERVRVLPGVCLAGNHDWAVMGRLNLAEFNADARQAVLWTRKVLTSENLQFLQDLPSRLDNLEEVFTLAHASPRAPVWEYILSADVARLNFSHFGTSYCFVGHTHVPAIFIASKKSASPVQMLTPRPAEVILLGADRMIINPGSVGQPRDGNSMASFVLLDTEKLTIEYRRVNYPIEDTQRRMEAAGLPPRLSMRLSFGW